MRALCENCGGKDKELHPYRNQNGLHSLCISCVRDFTHHAGLGPPCNARAKSRLARRARAIHIVLSHLESSLQNVATEYAQNLPEYPHDGTNFDCAVFNAINNLKRMAETEMAEIDIKE